VRALHVTSYFAPAWAYGGPPRSILGLCASLRDAGVDVEVFTTNANDQEELPPSVTAANEYRGIPVRYFPRAFPRRFFGASGMKKALERELRSFDLVHVHGIWNVPGWLAMDACRRQEVPFVVSLRGMLDRGSFDHHRFRKSVFFRLWERENLRRASFLHATSEHEAAGIHRLGIGPEVVVIPNGVDAPRRSNGSDFRNRWGFPPRARLVSFLGRLHPMKRLDLLLAAFEIIRRAHPDAVLAIAGRPDGIDPLSLDGRTGVHYLGAIDEREKWELLAESAALVLCSDSESFGMAVAEALSMGVPVVATRTCPWEELETNGCGFWVGQDSTEIAAGVEHLLSDRDLARRMGENAAALAARRYRWAAVGRDMAQSYARFASRKPEA
jgi:glycosyltransferase involved in cell wall biosynthesis